MNDEMQKFKAEVFEMMDSLDEEKLEKFLYLIKNPPLMLYLAEEHKKGNHSSEDEFHEYCDQCIEDHKHGILEVPERYFIREGLL